MADENQDGNGTQQMDQLNIILREIWVKHPKRPLYIIIVQLLLILVSTGKIVYDRSVFNQIDNTGINDNLSGYYYYITTPQGSPDKFVPLPVACPSAPQEPSKPPQTSPGSTASSSRGASQIGGTVYIDHKKNKRDVSFNTGERLICTDIGGKPYPLAKAVDWRSDWGFIENNQLITLLRVSDKNRGLVHAKLNEKYPDQSKIRFDGEMTYYSIDNDSRAITTTIKFYKCPDQDTCVRTLTGVFNQQTSK